MLSKNFALLLPLPGGSIHESFQKVKQGPNKIRLIGHAIELKSYSKNFASQFAV